MAAPGGWQVFAVDPDTNGALVIVRGESVGVIDSIEIVDCPVTLSCRKKRVCPERVTELLGEYTFPPGTEVYLEEATTPRHFGAHSALVQGTSFGTWFAALTSVGLTVHTVTGRTWKAQMGLTGKPKRASRELAKQIFPEVHASSLSLEKHHGRAEALLIAAHGHMHSSPPDDELKARVRRALASSQ